MCVFSDTCRVCVIYTPTTHRCVYNTYPCTNMYMHISYSKYVVGGGGDTFKEARKDFSLPGRGVGQEGCRW